MSDNGFVDRINNEYFDGGLSPAFLDGIRQFPTERQDVQAFIERMCGFADQAGLRASDFSALQGDVLGTLMARILPGAWNGRVPPITVKGRHMKIDQLVRNNRYTGERSAGRMLDLGCGFPPETTVDSADALAGWTIHGSDPSIPTAMVHDAEGNYATFDEAGQMIYCQPFAPTVENWNTLLSDSEATAARFRSIRDSFGAAGPGEHESADGSRLFVDPKSAYERDGLTFGIGGIGQIDASEMDVIRCFNVLYYFDDDFRQKALDWFATVLADGGILVIGGDWAFTTECRYFLYQKEGDHMLPREFTFSLDNVVPFGVVPFFSLHPRDRGMTLLARMVRTLREDPDFLARYYEVTDGLRTEFGICARDADGFYGNVDENMDPGTLWTGAMSIAERIGEEMGDQAVDVLRAAGHDAWVNEIGMVSVALEHDVA
jgi:hypothetical protein